MNVENKTLAALALVALLVVGAAVYMAFPSCKEPELINVALSQLQCAQTMDWASLKVEACQKLYQTDDCEFKEEDRGALEELVNGAINKCAAELLKANGMCSDNIPRINL